MAMGVLAPLLAMGAISQNDYPAIVLVMLAISTAIDQFDRKSWNVGSGAVVGAVSGLAALRKPIQCS